MRHFRYVLDASKPAPAGTLNAVEWFRTYKLGGEGLTYVPVEKEAMKLLDPVEPGDILWFEVFEEPYPSVFIGYARVETITEDFMNGRVELWFPAEALRTGVLIGAPQSHYFVQFWGLQEDYGAQLLRIYEGDPVPNKNTTLGDNKS